MQGIYLAIAIAGAVVPLRFFVRFLMTFGLDLPLFFQQLFQNDVSTFFGTDVIVSTLALLVFVFSEGRRRRMKHLWVYVICNLAVGVSLALPLFLFFRERSLRSS